MEKILSINSGSSSIKFKLFEFPNKDLLFEGSITQIGLLNGQIKYKYKDKKIKLTKQIKDHKQAVALIKQILEDEKVIVSSSDISLIGHRVVHGGEEFKNSVIVNEDVILKLKKIYDLAPLHNPHNVMGYEVFSSFFKEAKHAFIFDTSFHSTMEEEEFLYPIDYDYYEKYKIRKYGFHGTSHKFLYSKVKDFYNEDRKTITLHIGNGASLCAIKEGKSIATSMGFTPLSGIMMGTRSGDIDPSIITFLMEKENKSAFEVIDCLNKKSGLLGVSQISSDSIELEKEYEKGNKKAILAYEKMVNTIVERLGAYFVKLQGLEVIVFSGGIGENSCLFRELVIEKLKGAFNINLDKSKNENIDDDICLISEKNSSVDVLVIKTDEEIVIAQETYNLFKGKK